MDKKTYYMLDSVPCIVTETGSKLSAEGYFVGKGLRPVSVTAVRWQGEEITEREYQAKVAAQSIAARKKTLV